MSTVSDFFGSMVFDDRVMRANLSADVYSSLRKTIDEGTELDIGLANAVAQAMKDWAVAHGATHFTHQFQPLTGITAEKHDSLIAPSPDGSVIMEFSGKEHELRSRRDIMLDNYCKSIIIEANTMVNMVRTEIAPAIDAYAADVARAASAKKAISTALNCSYETGLVEKLSRLTDEIAQKTDELDAAIIKIQGVEDIVEESAMIRDNLLPVMNELCVPCDKAELITAKSYWPFPTYGDLLFSVK